jgi:hypothetical protein
MNFDMLPDHITTLFLSVVISIFLILAAEFSKACFATVGPSHQEQNASELNHTQNCVLCRGLMCPYCDFPVTGPRVDEVLSEISRDSDSSYELEDPDLADSNAEENIAPDSIWVRARRNRLRRVPCNSIESEVNSVVCENSTNHVLN